MSSSPLVIKNTKGWFAAGVEVAKALNVLSDGAFRLFVYLCLNARRDTGTLETTQTELARNLKRGPAAIRRHLREMEVQGICHSHFTRSPHGKGLVKVDECYWPYRMTDQEADDEAEAFVAQVKALLQQRACFQASFSTADEILAREWFKRAVPIEKIEKAILLGCARKYVSWRNNQAHGPIRSLRYFESVLQELDQAKVEQDYWDYIRSKLSRMEKLWVSCHTGEQNLPQAETPPL
jgi:hypothetical protein